MSRPDKYDHIKEVIKTIFEYNKGRYGYRRIHIVLRQYGYTINHKTLQKLMKELSLQGKRKTRKYRSYRGLVGKIAPNILNRQFSAKKPYEKLVTDVTEFKICNEKVYLSPVMDLFNREIIAHSISRRPTFDQIKDMLNKLFLRLPTTSRPLLHSDQGSLGLQGDPTSPF